jgi:hypothetical protein
MSILSFYADSFNESNDLAVMSQFMSARAEYRVFLDLSWTMILLANQTITSLPAYIPKPTYAKELIANATSIYLRNYYGMLLEVSGGTIQKYTVSTMLAAETDLYSSQASAFNYAKRAFEYAKSYGSEQERVWNMRVLQMNSQFGIAVLIVVIFAVTSSAYSIGPGILAVCRRLRRRLEGANWWPGVTEEFEKERSLNILLRTSGTLIGAIVALLVIMSVLNSLFASQGMAINLQFAMSFIGGFLGPIITLTLSLVSGAIALFLGPGKKRQWMGFLCFFFFIAGALFFAMLAYALQISLKV